MMRNRNELVLRGLGSGMRDLTLSAVLGFAVLGGLCWWSVMATAEAGVPPGLAQGFSEIVKQATPAVVNIAVTGGEGGRREGRRPLPPGPV